MKRPYGGKRCRYGYIVGAIHESPEPRWQIPPWPDEWHTAAILIVGADAYPKGTGSGSRSFLAGRHWRSAARAPVTGQGGPWRDRV